MSNLNKYTDEQLRAELDFRHEMRLREEYISITCTLTLKASPEFKELASNDLQTLIGQNCFLNHEATVLDCSYRAGSLPSYVPDPLNLMEYYQIQGAKSKLEGVKFVKRLTSMGLKESKEFYEKHFEK